MQKLPPTLPSPEVLDPGFILGVLLLVGAGVLFMASKSRLAAVFSGLLGLAMLGTRRGKEEPEPEVEDPRAEQTNATETMDETVRAATRHQSPSVRALRLWARGGDDRGEP